MVGFVVAMREYKTGIYLVVLKVGELAALMVAYSVPLLAEMKDYLKV